MAAKPQGEEKRSAPSRGITPARIAAIGALAVVVIVLAIVLFSGGGGHKYTFMFQNAGPAGERQPGDGRRLAGRDRLQHRPQPGQPGRSPRRSRTGTARRDDGGDPRDLALRRRQPLPLDQPRAEQQPGARRRRRRWASPRRRRRSTSTSSSTASRRRCAKGCRTSSRATAQIYAGRGKEANESYKYFGTALNRATAFASELNADEQLLSKLPGQLQQPDQRGRRPRGAAVERDLQRQHRLPGDQQPERRAGTDAAKSCRR